MSAAEAAWGVHQVVNENMANAARVHAVERGKDPRSFPLFAFGGAGPVHGFRVAEVLGAPALIAPFGAGVTSTVGFLAAPLAFDFVRSSYAQVNAMDWGRVNALLGEMQAEGEALLSSSGVEAVEIRHARSADMRYVGQGHEVRVPLPAGSLGPESAAALLETFDRVYRELYGRSGPPVPVEVINWRLVSSGPKPELTLAIRAATAADESALKGSRQAYFPELGGYVDTAVYDRYRLAPGDTFAGPAIVEERESTVVIGPTGRARVDEQLNLVVQLTDRATEASVR
jgi:N-methylhydantoinase A